jgi:hypothetical protein
MQEIKKERQHQPRDFEDPKIILTASLLRQRDVVVSHINNGLASSAFRSMATLLTQIDIDPGETELLKAEQQLVENTVRSTLPASKVMYYFQQINAYLNKTYFADFHKARPKFGNEGHI